MTPGKAAYLASSPDVPWEELDAHEKRHWEGIGAAGAACERARILGLAERMKEPHARPGSGAAEYAVPLVLLRAELGG